MSEQAGDTVVYEVEYSNKERTILTNIETAVLFCRDTYLVANVNVWLRGNMIATMYISPEKI